MKSYFKSAQQTNPKFLLHKMEETKKQIKAVLFDLDGTLIDHFTTIWKTINYAQGKVGVPLSSYEEVHSIVGGSIFITMERLTSPELRDEALEHFFEHFAKIWREDLKLLDGVREILEHLQIQGIKTAVFTNKRGPVAREVTEYLELDKLLEFTLGTVDTPYKKPDPRFTQHALEKIGFPAENTALVGDSPWDFEAGKSCDLGAIWLVSTGTHSLEELNKLGADGSFKDLISLKEKLF